MSDKKALLQTGLEKGLLFGMNKNNKTQIDFQALNAAALAIGLPLFEKLLPGGKLCGHEYKCANLFGGAGQSCSVNIKIGKWADFATGEKGGDVISLVAGQHKTNQYEGARILAEMLNFPMLDNSSARPIKKQDNQQKEKLPPIMPVPENIAGTLPDMLTRNKPTEFYIYKDTAGALLGYVARFVKHEIKANGKHEKSFAPLVYTSNGWKWQDFTKPYPFYGLENLSKMDTNAKILIVEGEHKADAINALAGLNMAVLSLHGGSKNGANMDFTPLKNRCVYYWPDNDEPGFKAAITFARAAMGICASLKIIEPPKDVKETWDLGNAIEESGWGWVKIEGHIIGHRCNPDKFERLANEKWQKDSLICLDIEQLLKFDIPPRRYVLKPILLEKGHALIHAARGVGKTQVALEIAYAVATGGTIFEKWQAPEPMRVLIIDGEMAIQDMQERMMSIILSNETETLVKKNLRFLCADIQNGAMPNLSDKTGPQNYETYIKDADLIILDNLSTLSRFGDPNDERSWQPMEDFLLDMRRRNKTVFIVHHQNKAGLQRGTGRKEDLLETIIALRPPKDYEDTEGARFQVIFEKHRNFYGKHAESFEAKLVTEQNKRHWIVREITDTLLNELTELLAAKMSVRECAVEMGISAGKVQRLKKKLETQKKK